MCFSATASFGASALLLGIGILSIKNTKTKDQKFLASIPLIFSAQQAIEGLVWTSIADGSYVYWEKPSIYGFLIIAQVLWPILIPYSLLVIEKAPIRRRILSFLWLLGIIQGIYFGYGLFYFPVSANISHSHIRYEIAFPAAQHWYGGVFYMLATALSPFLSSIKKVKFIGLIILITYFISYFFYRNYVISIWCYFAAIISLLILWVSLDFKKRLTRPNIIIEA